MRFGKVRLDRRTNVSFTPTSMVHYDFHKEFRIIYDKALRLYQGGKRDSDEFFTKLAASPTSTQRS